MNNKYILGIDTSNYKTSIAVIDNNGDIACDIRRFLKVKQGERGLRQSDALFQHIKNLPEMMEELRQTFHGAVAGVSAASRPRPVEGSYMPVFLVGEGAGRSIAAAMDVPFMTFSHQEGHIEGIKSFSALRDELPFLACHFSGGTSELLKVSPAGDGHVGYVIDIIGGSKDIAFGQVIDRAGVLMGMDFPAGQQLDRIALESETGKQRLTPIKVEDGWLNLSGIDTQIKQKLTSNIHDHDLIKELFDKLAQAMVKMIMQGVEKTGIHRVIMAGGVASSRYMRKYIKTALHSKDVAIHFDDRGLAQDNAVGIALLGGKTLWP